MGLKKSYVVYVLLLFALEQPELKNIQIVDNRKKVFNIVVVYTVCMHNT